MKPMHAVNNGPAGLRIEHGKTVEIDLRGVEDRSARLYLLDEDHDMARVDTLTLKNKLTLTVPLYSTYFLKID